MAYLVGLVIGLVGDAASIFVCFTTAALNPEGDYFVYVLFSNIVMTIEESIVNLTPIIVAKVSEEILTITSNLIPNLAILAQMLSD